MLAGLRIRLSDREAMDYLNIGSMIVLLFAMTILYMSLNSVRDAGDIFPVMTYMWMSAMNLDGDPQLLEKKISAQRYRSPH